MHPTLFLRTPLQVSPDVLQRLKTCEDMAKLIGELSEDSERHRVQLQFLAERIAALHSAFTVELDIRLEEDRKRLHNVPSNGPSADVSPIIVAIRELAKFKHIHSLQPSIH